MAIPVLFLLFLLDRFVGIIANRQGSTALSLISFGELLLNINLLRAACLSSLLTRDELWK